jgi:hypothetical protein
MTAVFSRNGKQNGGFFVPLYRALKVESLQIQNGGSKKMTTSAFASCQEINNNPTRRYSNIGICPTKPEALVGALYTLGLSP